MDVLESLDLTPCINLRSIHIDGFQIGPSNRIQRTALETLLEKILNYADAPHLRDITLTIEVNPHIRHMLAFFGIPEVVLFRKFDWGRIPEIMARWRGWARGFSGIDRNVRGKELAIIIQRCSEYQREGIEQVLRQSIFREMEMRAGLFVRFDDGESVSLEK